MSIHIAANTGCNLGCTYCYEEPDREAKQEQIDNEYDIDLIMEQLEEFKERYGVNGEVPGMHGGEPLLLRDEHLEKIFSWIYENYNQQGSHIQSNGTLLTEDHVEMFAKYDVSVGLSMDGPGQLNKNRIARSGGEDVTDEMTERTEDAIEKLIEHPDTGVGIIVVAHKNNVGTDEKLEELLDWIDYLNKNGVSGHYNPAIPYEDVQEDLSMTPERLKEVYLRTWEFVKQEDYRKWDPMVQFQNNLLGFTLGNCVNNKCDVYNAKAAKIIKGDGSTTGCGKTWGMVGDGVPFLQGPSTGNDYQETEERYEILKQVPGPYTDEVQEGEVEDLGGCKGCKYWAGCQGGCPSAGLDYDYRMRVRWCPAVYALYEKIEHDMRAMFPGIRLITDVPWDVEISEIMKRGQLDIQPFAAMRHETVQEGSDPSVRGKQTIDEVGRPYEEVVRTKKRHQGQAFSKEDHARIMEKFYEKRDPRVEVTIKESGEIHADSDTSSESGGGSAPPSSEPSEAGSNDPGAAQTDD